MIVKIGFGNVSDFPLSRIIYLNIRVRRTSRDLSSSGLLPRLPQWPELSQECFLVSSRAPNSRAIYHCFSQALRELAAWKLNQPGQKPVLASQSAVLLIAAQHQSLDFHFRDIQPVFGFGYMWFLFACFVLLKFKSYIVRLSYENVSYKSLPHCYIE